MKYWLDTFNEETWAEFIAAGGSISGFPARQVKAVNRLREGDILICYITGKKVFNAVLKVVGKATRDTSRIWKTAVYPIRIPVEVSRSIPIEQGISILSLKDQLTWFRNLKSPSAWTFRIRNTPYEISDKDAKVIMMALDKTAMSSRRPHPSDLTESEFKDSPASKSGPTHEKIQWLLLSLGAAMQLNLWVAKNDRNKSYNGQNFSDFRQLRQTLPVQFDLKTQGIIEYIDVLWLKGNSIRAAFEIEHTTSIYSGLLRMSDLITLQPNLNINLFIVAPDERRDKVRSEINRPTFDGVRLPSV